MVTRPLFLPPSLLPASLTDVALLHLTPVPAREAPEHLCVFVDLELQRGSNLPLRQGERGLLVFPLQIHFQKTPLEMPR